VADMRADEPLDPEGFVLVTNTPLRRLLFDGDYFLRAPHSEDLRENACIISGPDGPLYLRWEA